MKGTLIERIIENVPMSIAFNKMLSDLEKELSIPKGFFQKIVHEDDWSFIIKLHALFESALSFLIAKSLGDDRLIDIFTELDTSNLKKGKLAFIKILGLLDRDHQTFIQKLSELRNDLVHDISNIDFDLKKHFEGLDLHQKKTFSKHFLFYDKERIAIKENHPIFEIGPKPFIWVGALSILSNIYVKKKKLELERQGYKGLLGDILKE